MADTVSDQMYAAAVTQAEQLAAAAMERELALARHIRQAMDVVAPADHTDGLDLEERDGWGR